MEWAKELIPVYQTVRCSSRMKSAFSFIVELAAGTDTDFPTSSDRLQNTGA